MWLPTYWFFGLFQQLNGSMLSGLAPLASRAWIGLAVAAFAAGTTVLLSFRYTLRKTVEEPDILPSASKITWPPSFGNSLQVAVLLFTTRTLLRSRQHRVILSFYLGIGFAVALAYIKFPFGQHGLSQLRHNRASHRAIFRRQYLDFVRCGGRHPHCVSAADRITSQLDLSPHRTQTCVGVLRRRSSLAFCAQCSAGMACHGRVVFLFFPRSHRGRTPVSPWTPGRDARRTQHARLSESSIHLFLSAGKGKSSVRILGLRSARPAFNQHGSKLRRSRCSIVLPAILSMILVLGIVATLARWRSSVVARPILGMQFDEAMPPDIFALKLHRN